METYKSCYLDNTSMGKTLSRDYVAINFLSIFTPYMYKSYTNTVRYMNTTRILSCNKLEFLSSYFKFSID